MQDLQSRACKVCFDLRREEVPHPVGFPDLLDLAGRLVANEDRVLDVNDVLVRMDDRFGESCDVNDVVFEALDWCCRTSPSPIYSPVTIAWAMFLCGQARQRHIDNRQSPLSKHRFGSA